MNNQTELSTAELALRAAMFELTERCYSMLEELVDGRKPHTIVDSKLRIEAMLSSAYSETTLPALDLKGSFKFKMQLFQLLSALAADMFRLAIQYLPVQDIMSRAKNLAADAEVDPAARDAMLDIFREALTGR